MMGCLCPRKPSPVRQWSRPSLPGTRGGSQWPQAGEGTGPGHCAPRSGWAEPWEPPCAAELTWVRPGRSLTGRRVGWARPPWRRVMWWTAGWMRARWSRWGSRRPSHLWEGVGTGLSPHPSALTSGPTGGSQPAGWGGRGGWTAGSLGGAILVSRVPGGRGRGSPPSGRGSAQATSQPVLGAAPALCILAQGLGEGVVCHLTWPRMVPRFQLSPPRRQQVLAGSSARVAAGPTAPCATL